jgi:hypothetical protein
MDKVILVIGSVTATHYRDIRLSLIRRGYKPKIVRMTFEELVTEMLASSEDLILRYASPNGEIELFSTEYMEITDRLEAPRDYDEFIEKLAEKHLEPYGDIAAMIMDEQSDLAWSGGDNPAGPYPLICLQKRNIKRHVISNKHYVLDVGWV